MGITTLQNSSAVLTQGAKATKPIQESQTNQDQFLEVAMPPVPDNREQKNDKARDPVNEFEAIKKGSTDWEEKFERQKEGAKIPFNVGEKVFVEEMRVVAVIDAQGQIDNTKISLLVEYGSETSADRFVMSVTPEEHKSYMQNPGNVYKGVLEIQGEGKYLISNMFDYPAKALALQSDMIVNPNFDSVQKLKPGTKALVQGEVISIMEMEGSHNLVLKLKIKEGEFLDVLVDKSVEFEASPGLETAAGKKPMIGDVIQVSGNVRNFPEELNPPSDGGKGFKIVSAPWCRSTYLLEPSADRLKEFKEIRAETASQLEDLGSSLASKDYKLAREIHSRLMNVDRTGKETTDLMELQAKFPEMEKPIILYDRYEPLELGKAFGVNIDSMTKEEFKQFATDQVGKIFAENSNHTMGQETYLYRVMRDLNFSESEQEALLIKAIDTRLEYFQRIKENGDSYEHERDFNDQYFLESSIKYLSGINSVEGVEKIMAIMRDCMKDPDNEVHRKIIFTITSSIRDSCYEASRGEKGELSELLQRSIPEFTDWSKQLKALDSSGNHFRIKALEEGISFLQPKLEELRSENFEANLQSYLDKFADANSFMDRFAKEAADKDYKFRVMDQDDETIPADLRAIATDRIGAITVPSRKEVYLNLPVIESLAQQTGQSLENALLTTLANEAVHVIESTIFRPLSSKQTKIEIEKMSETPNALTDSEKIIQKLIVEEVVSELVGNAIATQYKDPKHKILVSDINIKKPEFANIAGQLGTLVLGRVYDFKGIEVTDGMTTMIAERLTKILTSNKFKEEVLGKLRNYGLLNENNEKN